MSEPNPTVQYDRVDDVAVIRLDDGKANVFTFDVFAAIQESFDRAEKDDAAAIAIVGRPGCLSGGFDLSVMTSGDSEQVRALVSQGDALLQRVLEAEVPVVAGVTGHAIALGGILLACVDHRVGPLGKAKIGLNEVAIGIAVPKVLVDIMGRRLTPSAVHRSILLAHLHDAEGAMAAGYLDELVPPEQVVDRSIEVAAQLGSTLDRRAFATTRRILNRDLVAQFRAGKGMTAGVVASLAGGA